MDTFAKFGNEFQLKLLYAVLNDVKYLSTIYDILNEDYFDSPVHKWILKKSKEYFKVYRGTPSDSMFKYELSKMTNINDCNDTIKELELIKSFSNSDDIEYIKDTTIVFCKQQEIRNAINDSIDLLQVGDYDSIEHRIISAVQKSIAKDNTYDYAESLVNRYDIVHRNAVTTGWEVIDYILDGGLGNGDLGVIVGPGGSGKSWVLQHLSANAFKNGKHILYVSLELGDTYVGRRIDTILTHIPSNRLPDNIDTIQDEIGRFDGKLSIEWFPEKSLSVVGLRSLIDKLKYDNAMPDMVVIDYADLMKVEENSRRRYDQLLQELYQQLRGIAGEYQIPIWTASQSGRGSINEEIIDADKIAESMGKHYTADFMMSITRRESDVRANKAMFYVIKNRYGIDKMQYVADMNTLNGTLQIYNQNSTRGTQIRAKIDESAAKEVTDATRQVNALLTKKMIE